MFEAGSDPQSKDTSGDNAFHQQVYYKNKKNGLAVSECLHAYGVDINA
jgi:hypothetical protein